MAEVERSLLRLAEAVVADREHRAALDERLDHRARVDPDDRGGKVDRVVVERLVGDARSGCSAASSARSRSEDRRARPPPIPRRCPVRPDQDAVRLSEVLSLARSAASHPRTKAISFSAGAIAREERRRERTAPRERSRVARRTPPGRARVAREPIVEELRAGDDDVSRRRAVQLDGLALLALVPDEDAVGRHLDEPLRRELIPARDGEPDRNPQLGAPP